MSQLSDHNGIIRFEATNRNPNQEEDFENISAVSIDNTQ